MSIRDRLYGPPSGGGGSEDHGLANWMFQQDHAAKLKARQQASGNGRTHISLGTNVINQTDHLEREFKKMADPVGKALGRVSPTGARFNYGQPSSWNLREATETLFTANKAHGMPVGWRERFSGGDVEVISETQVKAYIRIG